MKRESSAHPFGINYIFLMPHFCAIALSHTLQLEESPLACEMSWPCLLKRDTCRGCVKRGVTAMGRIFPPGSLRGSAQLCGTVDPTSAACKVQKRVVLTSAVLHLLSFLAYREVRVTVPAARGCFLAAHPKGDKYTHPTHPNGLNRI